MGLLYSGILTVLILYVAITFTSYIADPHDQETVGNIINTLVDRGKGAITAVSNGSKDDILDLLKATLGDAGTYAMASQAVLSKEPNGWAVSGAVVAWITFVVSVVNFLFCGCA